MQTAGFLTGVAMEINQMVLFWSIPKTLINKNFDCLRVQMNGNTNISGAKL